MPQYYRITSPDRETYDSVSHLVSVRGVSIMAANFSSLSHIMTHKPNEKIWEQIEALGATIEAV